MENHVARFGDLDRSKTDTQDSNHDKESAAMEEDLDVFGHEQRGIAEARQAAQAHDEQQRAAAKKTRQNERAEDTQRDKDKDRVEELIVQNRTATQTREHQTDDRIAKLNKSLELQQQLRLQQVLAEQQLSEFVEQHKEDYGRVIYDLEGQFGVNSVTLRQQFDFYARRFLV